MWSQLQKILITVAGHSRLHTYEERRLASFQVLFLSVGSLFILIIYLMLYRTTSSIPPFLLIDSLVFLIVLGAFGILHKQHYKISYYLTLWTFNIGFSLSILTIALVEMNTVYYFILIPIFTKVFAKSKMTFIIYFGDLILFGILLRSLSVILFMEFLQLKLPFLLATGILLLTLSDFREARLQEKIVELAESQAQLKAVMENSPVNILIITGEGEITFRNHNHIDQILHGEQNIFNLFTPKQCSNLREGIQDLRDHRTNNVNLRLEVSKGEVISWVDITISHVSSPSSDNNGFTKVVVQSYPKINDDNQFIVIMVDVTEEVTRIEEEKIRNNKNQEIQKLEAIGKLSSRISHDFNNLLMIIIGYTQLLYDEVSPEEKQEYLSAINNACDQAAAVVNQLLSFSKKHPKRKEMINLNKTIKGVQQFFQLSKFKERFTFKWELDPQLPSIIGDPHLLSQIFMNLLMNATEAMPYGGLITVSTQVTQTDVVVKVQDTGEGIPEELRDKIFLPYFTTKKSGTGLGLAIIHNIISDHGGQVALHSKMGEGTTFTLRFPINEKGLHAHPSTPNSEQIGGTHTLLIIDDNLSLLKTLELNLQKRGYIVQTASSPYNGLEIYQEKYQTDPFSIVLTDISMPEVHGYAVAEKILEFNPSQPILLMSGFFPETENSQIQQLPRIQKPIRSNTLEQVCISIIQKNNPRAQKE